LEFYNWLMGGDGVISKADKQGYTLVDLIIVLAVLSIMAATVEWGVLDVESMVTFTIWC
jgi:prepilin-type N-terminal cleavage/methylation domain-containing protein